jgi:hypothetical protein
MIPIIFFVITAAAGYLGYNTYMWSKECVSVCAPSEVKVCSLKDNICECEKP